MGKLRSYIIGFALSIVLTLAAFGAVVSRDNLRISAPMLIAVLFVLAAAQLAVQLVFFLHMGREARPRWNQLAFIFMALVLVIIVGGSLWIMKNLDYNINAQDPTQAIMQDEGISHHK